MSVSLPIILLDFLSWKRLVLPLLLRFWATKGVSGLPALVALNYPAFLYCRNGPVSQQQITTISDFVRDSLTSKAFLLLFSVAVELLVFVGPTNEATLVDLRTVLLLVEPKTVVACSGANAIEVPMAERSAVEALVVMLLEVPVVELLALHTLFWAFLSGRRDLRFHGLGLFECAWNGRGLGVQEEFDFVVDELIPHSVCFLE